MGYNIPQDHHESTPSHQPDPAPKLEVGRVEFGPGQDGLGDVLRPTKPRPFGPATPPEGLPQDAEEELREHLGEGADGGGKRMNLGKNRMELIPPEWPWSLADVTTQGSKKYAERNWEEGMKWSTMIGCMLRHLAKFQSGQRYDGDGFDAKKGTTGCHELAMVAWNALALMSYDLRNVGTNDLPEGITPEILMLVNAISSRLPNNIHERGDNDDDT